MKMTFCGLFLMLFLSGCATNTEIQVVEKTKVVLPPEQLYNCPELKNYPNPETLTNEQVANVIITLIKNNETCRNNIEAIKRYLQEARKNANTNG